MNASSPAGWIVRCCVVLAVACDGDDELGTTAATNGGSAARDAGSVNSGGRISGAGGTGGNIAVSGGAGNGTSTGGRSGAGGAPTSGGRSSGGAGGAPSDAGPETGSGPRTDGGRGAPGANLGSFQLTYYWVTAENDFSGTKDTTLYDDACGTLAVVTRGFADSLAIEGTGRLSDGRVLNISGSCSCGAATTCYVELDAQHPWGLGAQGSALVPFRTIAVDRNVIALGSHVYVAELDGVTMPGDASYGQFVHDGCVSADDVGGGITGQHIDFFAALEAHYQTLDGQLGLNSVTVYQGGQRCP